MEDHYHIPNCNSNTVRYVNPFPSHSIILIIAKMLDIRYLCALSSAAAVCFHVSTIYRELDFIVLRLLGIFIITCGVLTWTFYSYTNDIYSAVSMTAAIAVSFNSALTSSILLHRIFFHRLRRFPGPFWAKVSKAWMLKKVWSKPQSFRYVEQMHEEYGKVVRVGKYELLLRMCILERAFGGPF